MKKIYLFFVALPFLIVAACNSDDESYDFLPDIALSPYAFNFYVQDSSGNDLLDTANEKNILQKRVCAIFHDKEYPIDCLKDQYIMDPVKFSFSGLTLQFNDSIGKYYLSFGSFDPYSDVEDGILYISWGDGTFTKVEFNYRQFSGQSYDFRSCIDGKETTSRQYIITK